MAEIKSYRKFSDFLKANESFIYDNYLEHYHLIYMLEKLKSGQIEVYNSFNVVDETGSDVLYIHLSIGSFIYGTKWTKEIIKLLSEEMNFKNFKNGYSFSGQLDLITELFQYNETQINIFKNRFIESCQTVRTSSTQFTGIAENATLADFDELVILGNDYYQEEFRGQGSQNYNQIVNSVHQGIVENTMYIWRAEGVITSMVRIINDDDRCAIVGSLFTRKDFRGKGYAYFLLHTVTEGLLKAGYEKCGLV